MAQEDTGAVREVRRIMDNPTEMTPEQRAAYGMENARVWTFSGREFTELSSTQKASRMASNYKVIGVLACSFERAYDVIRSKYPRFRVERLEMGSAAVNHVADDPRVLAMLDRLGV
jgi:hypothetical protein